MKQIEVTNCINCPFFVQTPYCEECGTSIDCSLDENCNTLDNGKITPDWCPLLKEKYIIKHKEQNETTMET